MVSSKELYQQAEHATKKLKDAAPRSVAGAQQHYLDKINHYKGKYNEFKILANIDAQFLIGAVLMELMLAYRKTSMATGNMYGNELGQLLDETEKLKVVINENDTLKKAAAAKATVLSPKIVPKTMQETSTKDDDSAPSPNPPSTNDDASLPPTDAIETFENQFLPLSALFRLCKLQEKLLLIDYRERWQQEIAKPNVSARTFTSLQLVSLPTERQPHSIVLHDFSHQAEPPGHISDCAGYKYFVFMDQDGQLDFRGTSLYSAMVQFHMPEPIDINRVLIMRGGFLGWLAAMPQYSTDPKPVWTKPDPSTTSLQSPGPSGATNLPDISKKTPEPARPSNPASGRRPYSEGPSSALPVLPQDSESGGVSDLTSRLGNLDLDSSNQVSTPKKQSYERAGTLVPRRPSVAKPTLGHRNSMDDDGIDYLDRRPFINYDGIANIPRLPDRGSKPSTNLPSLPTVHDIPSKPTFSRSNKPAPLDLHPPHTTLKRRGSLSNIPSATSIEVATPSIAELKDDVSRFAYPSPRNSLHDIATARRRSSTKPLAVQNPVMPTKNIRGLKNLGNTCYMNAVLQCLVRVPEFNSYLMGKSYCDDIASKNDLGYRGRLVSKFAELTRSLHYDGNFLVPKDVRSIFTQKYADFATYKQQDAHEFLSFFLDGLHEDLNFARRNNERITHKEPPDDEFDFHSKKVNHREASQRFWNRHTSMNQSKIVDLFQGQFISITQSKVSSTVRRNFDSFMVMSVPIPEKRSSVMLEDCIKKFRETEAIDDFYEPTMKKHVKATKNISLWKLPPVLIIQISRFKANSYGIICEKLHTKVKLPKELVIDSNMDKRQKYRLFSFVEHSGQTLNSGHYRAYANHPNAEQLWFLFDDQDVSRVSSANVDSVLDSRTAYICFYTTLDPPKTSL